MATQGTHIQGAKHYRDLCRNHFHPHNRLRIDKFPARRPEEPVNRVVSCEHLPLCRMDGRPINTDRLSNKSPPESVDEPAGRAVPTGVNISCNGSADPTLYLLTNLSLITPAQRSHCRRSNRRC
ncbi:hypothetical protein J6590_001858 [Homalodisca vitripennis]|nr:hypothetical protein J6590_001858 [Homalodisca vitripennis]